MQIAVLKSSTNAFENVSELVERKGVGHPDTLADLIAEECSLRYSDYCLKEFGAIPHHWVDKCLIQGGRAHIDFGHGAMLSPIEVKIHGKVTRCVGRRSIPVDELFRSAVFDIVHRALYVTDFAKAFLVSIHTETAQGAGRTLSWYEPSTIDEITTPSNATSNDAAICAAYFPLTSLQEAVLNLEHDIALKVREQNRAIGTDIKILGRRLNSDIFIEACIPALAAFTPNRAHYEDTKRLITEHMKECLHPRFPNGNVAVSINTRDTENTTYMLVQGSAADTGDCGVVGRGNRANGLITPNFPMSLEAPAGKNPVYHAGRLYTLITSMLSKQIFLSLGLKNYCFISSATGDPITRPRSVVIELETCATDADVTRVKDLAATHIASAKTLSGNVHLQQTILGEGYRFRG